MCEDCRSKFAYYSSGDGIKTYFLSIHVILWSLKCLHLSTCLSVWNDFDWVWLGLILSDTNGSLIFLIFGCCVLLRWQSFVVLAIPMTLKPLITSHRSNYYRMLVMDMVATVPSFKALPDIQLYRLNCTGGSGWRSWIVDHKIDNTKEDASHMRWDAIFVPAELDTGMRRSSLQCWRTLIWSDSV